jgi:GT2 family glycosyltransferase
MTVDCLQALAKSTKPVNLIYVDNGSDPDDFEYVKAFAQSHFQKSICIRNDTNKGYTFACNQGLAISPKDHHVLMLNNDCRVEPDCVETLAVHLEWHPMTASVCPLTNDKGACSLKRSANQLAAGPTGRRRRVIPMDVLPWFCCMLHRDAVSLVPELPKDGVVASGLAVDDWWSRQLAGKGWQHLLCCDAFAEHDHSATFKDAGINRRSEQRKAARWLQRQH